MMDRRVGFDKMLVFELFFQGISTMMLVMRQIKNLLGQ